MTALMVDAGGQLTVVEFDAVPDFSGSCMVAFVPADPQAFALAGVEGRQGLEGALAPEDLHVTCCYLGDVDDAGVMWPEKATEIQRLLVEVAAQLPLLPAKVCGAGTLGDEGAVVLFLESEELVAVQTMLDEVLDGMDAYDPEATRYPSYVPHMTLGYEEGPGELLQAAQGFLGQELVIGALRFEIGEDVVDYPLAGQAPAEASTPDEELDEMAMVTVAGETFHLPGKHNQKSHGSGNTGHGVWKDGKLISGKTAAEAKGGGGGAPSSSAPAADGTYRGGSDGPKPGHQNGSGGGQVAAEPSGFNGKPYVTSDAEKPAVKPEKVRRGTLNYGVTTDSTGTYHADHLSTGMTWKSEKGNVLMKDAAGGYLNVSNTPRWYSETWSRDKSHVNNIWRNRERINEGLRMAGGPGGRGGAGKVGDRDVRLTVEFNGGKGYVSNYDTGTPLFVFDGVK